MKTRKELKQAAKKTLNGRWGAAVGVNLVYSLPVMLSMWLYTMLLAVMGVMLATTMNSADTTTYESSSSWLFTGIQFGSSLLFGWLITLLCVGVSFTMLDWARGKKKPAGDGLIQAFTQKYFLGTSCLFVLIGIFTWLWSLLLVIPGWIKKFSYSQAYYLYKDDVEAGRKAKSYTEYITASRKLMDGHKWELFTIHLSLLGWALLAALTGGIGYLWYFPYRNQILAEFYKSLADDVKNSATN